MINSNKISIALVDDHQLFKQAIVSLINEINPNYVVEVIASNGQDFIRKIAKANSLPDIIILDLKMPVMNGVETAIWLKENHPTIPVLILTMQDDENTLIKLLRVGVKGFLSKDIEPKEFELAISSILMKGYHYTEELTGNLIRAIQNEKDMVASFNDRESLFIQYCCSELTYKEIAEKMCLSPKTIDGYRASLFEKLELKSRVGLVLYSIKNDLVSF